MKIGDETLYSLGREIRVPSGRRIDLLLLGNKGNIIIVEVKRRDDPRIKDAVIGQIMDYRSALCNLACSDLDRMLNGTLRSVISNNKLDGEIWLHIDKYLGASKIKLIIAVDEPHDNLVEIASMLAKNNFPVNIVAVRKFNDNGTIKYEPEIMRYPSEEGRKRLGTGQRTGETKNNGGTRRQPDEYLQKLHILKAFLADKGIKTLDVREAGSLCSSVREGILFIIKIYGRGIMFSWQQSRDTRHDRAWFRKNIGDITQYKSFSGADEPTHRKVWVLNIPVDPEDFCERILAILEETSGKLGFSLRA